MSDINLIELTKKAEHDLADIFADIDNIAFLNTERVIDSFRTHRVDDTCFAGTSGYGHDDRGRDTLDAIYADVFGAESAFVRHTIANGTMAITIGLYGLLRPGDIMLAITGKPYDTLEEVVGISGQPGNGSLADFGVGYRQVGLLPDGGIDFGKADEIIKAEGDRVKVVFIQRSKGYLDRPTLTVDKMLNRYWMNPPAFSP